MVKRPNYQSNSSIGGWNLLEYLGSGGNAEVWRAERSGEVAALKILNQKKTSSEPYRRFCEEIHVLRKLGHYPGVLPLIDCSLPEFPTRSAPAWLALPVATTVRGALGSQPILKDVVGAISSFAHTLASLTSEYGIHHRDLKPENLYRWNESWCLGDFGLVDYPGKEDLTAPGKWIGSIHYLAPELLRAPDEADYGPADVYAMAKTLWVLSTGQNYPLPGFLLRQVPQFRIGSYIIDGRAHMLETLVERATQHDSIQRPTMTEMAKELSAWLNYPYVSAPLDDLSDLQIEISPILQSHIVAQAAQDECARRVEELIQESIERLQPLSEDLTRVTGLHSEVGVPGNISSLTESEEFFKSMPSYLSYRGAAFSVESPTRIGLGNNFISLSGGIAIAFSKDANLYLAGGYGVHFGTGKWRTIWHEKHKVRSGSASEAQSLSSILNGLNLNLRKAIKAFAEELSQRSPT